MPRQALERGPVPLHHQVYLDLSAALDGDEWRVGDRLPTERELAATYGCSLITVRRALADLAREGRLERSRGRGTFVTRPPIVRELTAEAGFADEMRSRGLAPFAVVLRAVTGPADPVVAGALRLPPGAPAHLLERVRGADGVQLLLERAWLPAGRFPGLLEEDFTRRSLYEVLERHYRCPVTRTRETLTAVLPTEEDRRLLGLAGRVPALHLEGTAFTTDDVPVEYSRTLVSPDRARYTLEMRGHRLRAIEPLEPGAAQRERIAPPADPATPRPVPVGTATGRRNR